MWNRAPLDEEFCLFSKFVTKIKQIIWKPVLHPEKKTDFVFTQKYSSHACSFSDNSDIFVDI